MKTNNDRIEINEDTQILTVITNFKTRFRFEEIFYRLNVLKKNKFISFLDSSLIPDKYSRFSYLAWEPEYIFRSLRKRNEQIRISDGAVKVTSCHPLIFLRDILREGIREKIQKIFINDAGSVLYDNPDLQETDFPDFTGGFMGYFSYDLKNYIEKLPAKAKRDLRIPLFYLNYYLKLLSYDHQRNKCYLIKNYRLPLNNHSDFNIKANQYKNADNADFVEVIKEDLSEEKQKILTSLGSDLSSLHSDMNKAITEKYRAKKINKINLVSSFTKDDYMASIKKAKKYIHNGDIYQVNITQRFSCKTDIEPEDLYFMLRQKNPAPFSAFISSPEITIGCSSPERFLYLKDGIVETRPIKGTRPRGRTEDEDKQYIKELTASIKDRAELNMIVDLERNDLGRFCRYGTVKVKEHAVVEKYARVFHLVSTVTGELQTGYDHTDIIKAAFPGGSITGAPKIRAMEIIDELEPVARNIYTGSIGYIGIDGTMDLNIVIRTFIIKNKNFYYNAGGGIVEDSIPESEYQESLDKGIALKETLEFFTG
jgi:para-aminobenzoate synthetase component I